MIKKFAWLVCTAWLLAACEQKQSDENWQSVKVKQGNFKIFVCEEGEIEALQKVVITSNIGGKIAWLIREGAFVKAGDIVAELEKQELEEELEQISDDLKIAQEHLESLQDSLADEKNELTASLEKFATNLEIARLHLKRLEQGPDENERKQFAAEFKQKQVAWHSAQSKWQRIQGYSANSVSQATLEELAWQKEITGLEYELEQLEHEEFLKGSSELAKKQAGLAVELARIDYRIAEKKLDMQLARLEDDVELARLTVEHLKDKQNLINERLRLHTIKTPSAGIVLYQKLTKAEKVAVGMDVWAGAGILEIPDLSRMKVKCRLRESAIRFIRPGHRMEVTVESLPDVVYPGRVIRIGRHGRDSNERLVGIARREQGPTGIRVFDVEAEILTVDPRLKLGLKAKVKIPLRVIENALWVQRDAVQYRQGLPFVFLQRGGEKVSMALELGEHDRQRVVVVDGLGPADLVYYSEKENNQ